HDAHFPQFVYGETVTFVPGASSGFEPPDTTVAAVSWPGIRGNETSGFFPRKEFRSLPHIPTMRTFSSTCSGACVGAGTASTAASPGLRMTSALIRGLGFLS